MAETTQKTEDKKTRADVIAGDKKRVPFGIPRTKLSVAYEIPGYHLHIINDTPGRIYQAQQGGYEFVQPDEVGMEDNGDGKVIFTAVGKGDDGSAYDAYLMKIRLDWYEEDQKQIDSIQDGYDDAIRRGTLEQKPSDNRYIPKDGVSLKRV